MPETKHSPVNSLAQRRTLIIFVVGTLDIKHSNEQRRWGCGVGVIHHVPRCPAVGDRIEPESGGLRLSPAVRLDKAPIGIDLWSRWGLAGVTIFVPPPLKQPDLEHSLDNALVHAVLANIEGSKREKHRNCAESLYLLSGKGLLSTVRLGDARRLFWGMHDTVIL